MYDSPLVITLNSNLVQESTLAMPFTQRGTKAFQLSEVVGLLPFPIYSPLIRTGTRTRKIESIFSERGYGVANNRRTFRTIYFAISKSCFLALRQSQIDLNSNEFLFLTLNL